MIDYFNMYDMKYDRDNIIITTGGSEALNMIFTAILNVGDEVLMPEPFYTNYHTFITSAGGKVVPVTTVAEEGYHYADREKIEKRITDKTKAIVCVNPGNPTGTILTEEEIKLILDIAEENDLWVIADEVYREFAYDSRKITSFGMFEEYSERIVIVDSISKRFSACGARIGCAITKNKELYSGLMKLAQGRLCASTVDQVGAAALYRLDRSYYDNIRDEYESRRDAVYEEIMKIPWSCMQKTGRSFLYDSQASGRGYRRFPDVPTQRIQRQQRNCYVCTCSRLLWYRGAWQKRAQNSLCSQSRGYGKRRAAYSRRS